MADDALASFQLLLKNIPEWIGDLENILTTATRNQAAFLAAEQPTQFTTDADRESSSSSPGSVRSREGALDFTGPTLLHQQLPHLTGSDVLRLSQRKRKTASVCSRAESQPSKYRSKAMVIVYYDTDTQKAFETLVRAIGTSRNSIRKSKLSMKLDSLTRSVSSSSSCSSEGEETIQGLGTFKYHTTTTLRKPVLLGDDTTAVYDRLDSALDKAQGMCEHAAHQVLRDGDCRIEINNAKEAFTQAIDTINAELPSLSKQAEKAAARKAKEDEDVGLEDDRRPSQHSLGRASTFSLPSDGVLEVDTDEAVEDSEDEPFDVSAVKLPPRFGKFANNRPQVPSITAVC